MRLSIVLPVALQSGKKRSSANRAPPSESSAGSSSLAASRAVKPRILCVDDEPMVLKSLAATLRKHYEVVPASGGAAALEMLEGDPGLRVVLSDFRMPVMNGEAFLLQVRARFPAVVRILLSGAGAEDGAVNTPGLFFRFLSKPCPRETLVGAIEDALTFGSAGIT